jgi:molybdopterin molybdotransferase
MQDAVPVAGLIDVAEAKRRVDAVAIGPPRLGAGEVLAVDAACPVDAPPWDKCLMDGFAVRASDLPGALTITGEAAAGHDGGTVRAGRAVAAMTGAPLPGGADAVVPIEWCAVVGDRVSVDRPVPVGHAVAKRGSDRRAGDVVLRQGTRLTPARRAALAHLGNDLPTYARPTVALLTTGDELVPPDVEPSGPQIRDTSFDMLADLLAGPLGCEVVGRHPRVPDDPAALRSTIEAVTANVIFIAGGVSMGGRDHVPNVLEKLGFEPIITKLRMRPGKPFLLAKRGGQFVVGLPGNPVSGFVCTLVLTGRLLMRLAGASPESAAPEVAMPLAEPLTKANGPRLFYQPCRLTPGGVVPLRWVGSADVFTLADADGLLVRPADDLPREAGALVSVVVLPR